MSSRWIPKCSFAPFDSGKIYTTVLIKSLNLLLVLELLSSFDSAGEITDINSFEENISDK